MKKSGKRNGVVIPPEIPGLEETNSVPPEMRTRAEHVVRLEEDIDAMKAEHKEELKKLMAQMIDKEILVIPVIIGNWKKRVKLKKSKIQYELEIEDIGLETKDKPKQPPVDKKVAAAGDSAGAAATVN